MEVPYLTLSTVLGLDYEFASDVVNISSSSKSGNNMEIGVDSHTELIVHLSFTWFFNPVFLVDKIPLLVVLSFSLSHVDVFVLSINCILNGSNLIVVFLVGKIRSLPFEELVPSRVVWLTSKPVT
jgi:hypothetical protein